MALSEDLPEKRKGKGGGSGMRMNKLTGIVLATVILLFGGNFRVYAVTQKTELFFYTVDGEELEKLHQTVRSDAEYTFLDPDRYKYLPYGEDADGKEIYPENNDLVKGLYWQEVTENDVFLERYTAGTVHRFSPGKHYFYVKTDDPIKTGENSLHTTQRDRVFVYFSTALFYPVDSLDTRFTTYDTFTFPDPDAYAMVPEENGHGYSGTGHGIYWSGEDDRGKRYLFKAGDKVRFNRGGDYEFHVVTDDPVSITFRYPMKEMMVDIAEGEVYRQLTARPGDSFNVLRSLGAIIWGESFTGWEEYNCLFETYTAGQQLTVYDNQDLNFYAVYEDDEDWDPEASDDNIGRAPRDETGERVITVDVGELNEQAGIGFDAYVTADGKVVRKNGNNRVNEKVTVTGVPGEIGGSEKTQDTALTSLSEGGDPKDPGSYKRDKYGRDASVSNIASTINGVLRQDDSAFYMDIYGNAMIYHDTCSRLFDMAVAYRRLKAGKNDSFLLALGSWDAEFVNRYEAIEFALLSGQYPGDAGSVYSQFNSNDNAVKQVKISAGLTGEERLPVWKDSYLSREAFQSLAVYKKLWKGWYDEYADDPVRDGNSDAIKKVGAAILDGTEAFLSGISNLFILTAYAAEPNSQGLSNRLYTRINGSTDLGSAVMVPKYYDASMTSTYSGWYMMDGVSGLSTGARENLVRIYNALIDHGYTEAMAAGACGNIWQESGFLPVDSGHAAGIVQWTDDRKTSFYRFCSDTGQDKGSLDAQIEYVLKELVTGYDSRINQYLKNHGGGVTVSTINDPELACEAFCAAFEGCVCVCGGKTHEGHGDACARAGNGTWYQHLNDRLGFTRRVADAAKRIKSRGTGVFSGCSNEEILLSLYGYSTMKQIASNTTAAERRKDIISIRLSDGRYISCSKFIADDLKAALDELLATGFPLDSTTYCYSERGTNSGGLSFHALGLAVDINCGGGSTAMGWAHNPQFYYRNYTMNEIIRNYQPFKDPYAITTVQYEIMKAYGFLWGRDFRNQPDIMHFSVGEVGQDGYHSEISEKAESYYRSYR